MPGRYYTREEIRERIETQFRHMGLEGVIRWIMDLYPDDLGERNDAFGQELRKMQKQFSTLAGQTHYPMCGGKLNGLVAKSADAPGSNPGVPKGDAGSTPAKPTFDDGSPRWHWGSDPLPGEEEEP